MNNISDGWFTKAKKINSPNYDKRPHKLPIDAIILHSISLPPGCYQGNDIDCFFSNQLDCNKSSFYKEIQTLKVSSHLLIRRNGDLIQYVNLFERAWHAGQSQMGHQNNCNDFSIGIELEGTDKSHFEHAQYNKLTEVVLLLLDYFPSINTDRIVGHSDIAPGRKTDPGIGFDWHSWKNQLAEQTSRIK